MIEADSYKCMLDQNPDRQTGYVIMFQGLIGDDWATKRMR